MSFGFNSQHSSSTPQNVTPDALQANYGPFAGMVQKLLKTNISNNFVPKGGIPFAPNKSPGAGAYGLVARMGAGEKGALNQLNQTSAATNPMVTSYLGDVMGGDYLPGADKANPFLEGSIQAAQRPTQQALEDTLSRSLPGQFARVGQFNQPQMGSSAFDTAAATAYGRGANALGDIATNISSNAYGQERGLQQGAVGLNQQQGQSLINNLQANALPRLINQQGLQTGLDLFQKRISNLLSSLSLITQQSGASNIGNRTSSSGSGFNIGTGNLV